LNVNNDPEANVWEYQEHLTTNFLVMFKYHAMKTNLLN